MRPWIGIIFGMQGHFNPAVSPPENVKDRGSNESCIGSLRCLIALSRHPNQKDTDTKRKQYDEQIKKRKTIRAPAAVKHIEPEAPGKENDET